MTERRNVSSGAPWEARVGYSRVVRVGSQVFAAGTIASDERGVIQCPGDAYGQTVYAFRKIERAMAECGATLKDAVRTRMYVVSIGLQAEVGRAHREVFGDVMPAATMVEVSGLAAAAALVEVEVDAVVSGG